MINEKTVVISSIVLFTVSILSGLKMNFLNYFYRHDLLEINSCWFSYASHFKSEFLKLFPYNSVTHTRISIF